MRERQNGKARRLGPGWTGLLAFALLFPSLAAATSPSERYKGEVFPEVRVTRDILYRSQRGVGRDGLGLRLDLYEPAGDASKVRPLMIWAHGGGFYRGGKADKGMVELAEHFAKCGFVCASIEYRLLLRSGKEWLETGNLRRAAAAGAEDVLAALGYLVAEAGRRRIDPSRVILGGGSAGAFISLTAASSGKNGWGGATVRAVIDFWGGLVDASGMKPGFPPLLIIHGTRDKTVPFDMARRLAARAKEAGVACVLRPVEGEGHAPWEHMKTYLAGVHGFLDQLRLY